jgi:hypothetical protein
MANTRKKSNRNRKSSSASRGRKRGASTANRGGKASGRTQEPARESSRESMGREGMEDEGGLEGEPAARSGRASST